MSARTKSENFRASDLGGSLEMIKVNRLPYFPGGEAEAQRANTTHLTLYKGQWPVYGLNLNNYTFSAIPLQLELKELVFL